MTGQPRSKGFGNTIGALWGRAVAVRPPGLNGLGPVTKVGLDHFWVAADVVGLARGDDPTLHEGKHTGAHLKAHVYILPHPENPTVPFSPHLPNHSTKLTPL